MSEICVWCGTYAPANVPNDIKRICKGANVLNDSIAIRGADYRNTRGK